MNYLPKSQIYTRYDGIFVLKEKAMKKVKRVDAVQAEVKAEAKTDVEKVLTDADKLWNEIRVLPISMYGLPVQKVEDHVTRMLGAKDVVYLKLKSSAVVAGLEQSLNPNKYKVDQLEGYIMIDRVRQHPKLSELKPA